MSKNNFDERLRKMEPRKDHYSIRKFSVGVASVLIGFSFLGLGNTREVKAGTIGQPQSVETKKSVPGEQKQTAQDSQNKDNQSSLSTDNESQKVLNDVQAPAAQALQKQKAIEISKKNGSVSGTAKSEQKIDGDLGLTGRKDTDSESQNVKGQSEKNSASVSKNTDAAEKTAVKSDSKSGQVVNKKLTDSEENQSDAQMLTIKTSDIKSGKTDQADDLAKELTTDLTENKSGNKLNIKGVDGKLASGIEQTLDVNKTAGQDTKNQKNQADAKKLARLYGSLKSEIPNVTTWDDFISQLINPDIHEITLGNSISVGDSASGTSRPHPVIRSGYLQLKGSNIAHQVTINGQNKYALNFNKHYLSFQDKNQDGSNSKWDITFENMNINADGPSDGDGWYSPIYFGDVNSSNQKNIKVTFNNVTATTHNCPLISGAAENHSGENYEVIFEGTNKITNDNSTNVGGLTPANAGSTIDAGNVLVQSGITTIYMPNTNGYAQGLGGNLIRTANGDTNNGKAVEIAKNATLNLFGEDDEGNELFEGKNVRGIWVRDGLTGTVQVDGTLNAKMGTGRSTTIFAGNLVVNGTVKITTQQDNNNKGTSGTFDYNSNHYAVIALGVGNQANVTSATLNNLIDNGSLTIQRTTTSSVNSPLIAFGSGGVSGNYVLSVNPDATFNLQDSAEAKHNDGMISMFGSSSKDEVDFTQAKYINLQRVGSKTVGNLLRLEGTGNQVNINGTIPVAQWDEANTSNSPSFAWSIANLKTQNQWGDDFNGFVKAGTTINTVISSKGVDKLIDSNSTVTIGADQAGQNSYKYDGTLSKTGINNIIKGLPTDGEKIVTYETPYLNSFLNNFSWWKSQRIAMGSQLNSDSNVLKDADKYQPETKTIYTNMDNKLGDLSIQDGIKDLIGPDGVVKNSAGQADLSSIDFNNAGTTWIAGTLKDSNGNTVDQTKNFTAKGEYTALANIYYKDGSYDEKVLIPIIVGDKESDTYDTRYQGTTVKRGTTATVAVPSITKKTDGTAAPNTVTETYKRTSDTQSWVTVNNNGSLTLKPTTSTTVGMYNVPVLVTYNDKSSETVYAPVYVTNDDNHHVTWGKDSNGKATGAIVVVTDPIGIKAHETSGNSQVLNPSDAVSEIDQYKVDNTGKEVQNGTIDKSKANISWNGTAPTTTVDTPSINGSSLSGSIKIDLSTVNGIDSILGNDSKTITQSISFTAVGAAVKNGNPSVNVIKGKQPTSDQLKQLVDHSSLDNLPTGMAVDKYELKPGTSLDTSATGQKSVTIRILFKDKDAQGNQTYLDLPAISNGINVVDSDADTYDAHYQGTTIKEGSTGTIAKPSVTKKADGSVASNTVIKTYKSISDTPSWVKVNTDGSLSLTPPTDNSTVGMYNVPVLITYNDNSSETVYAPVYVTKDDVHHVTWGKDGHSAVVTVTQPVTLHQTSDSSMVTTDYAGQTIKEFDVYTKDATNPDKISTTADAYISKDGQYQDAAGQKLGNITVAWNGDPSTVVTTPGLTSSKTAEIKITFGAGSVPVSDRIFDADKSDTANVSLYLRGATEKTGYTPVQVVRGQQPTSDQLASLVDHSKLDDLPDGIKVDSYELVGTLDTSTTGKKDVTIRIVFKDKNGSGKETYLDLPAITNGINVIASDADKYVPSYSSTSLQPGQTVNVDPSWKNGVIPTAESFSIVTGTNTPTWASIDSTDGEIRFAPSTDVKPAGYRVPVKVTYQDGSSTVVYAPVYVSDGQHTATCDNNMDTMYVAPVVTYHKTTNSNDIDINKSGLDNIYHWDDANNETIWTLTHTTDGDYYVQTKGDQVGARFKASDITYTWITNLKGVSAPSTNVDAFGDNTDNTGSLLFRDSDGSVNGAELTGSDDDLPGNSKWRYHFTIGGDAPTVIDGSDDMWENIYFNFLGATGKQSIPVNVGDKVPTDAGDIEQYLDKNDVGVPSAVSAQPLNSTDKDWTVTNISWETNGKPGNNGKFDANASHLNGTVRFDFRNKNGNTSYLDVKVSFKTGSYVPHNNNNNDKNDSTNLYVTRTIHYDVPAGETAIPDKVQSVHYIRDGYHKINAQGNDLQDIIWNAWKLADGQTAKFPEIKTVNQFTGYDSYINGNEGTAVAAADVTTKKDKNDYEVPQSAKDITVTYKVSQENVKIIFNDVDPNAKDDSDSVKTELNNGSTTVSGNYGSSVDFSKITIPTNFVVDGTPTYKFTNGSDQQYTINLKHKTKTINQNNDHSGLTTDQIKDLTVNREYKEVAKMPAAKYGNDQTVEDWKLSLYRTGTLDLVTGKTIAHGAWQKASDDDGTVIGTDGKYSFKAGTVPSINNYTTKIADKGDIKLSDGNLTITISNLHNAPESATWDDTYTPKEVTRHIEYVDDDKNGAQVGSLQDVTGDVDTTQTVSVTVPANYELASGQSTSVSVDLGNVKGSDGSWDISSDKVLVHLVHSTEKIDKDHIPSGAKDTDGSDLTQKDFEQTVKRTITAEEPDHNGGTISDDLSQTGVISETATYDEVTGKVTKYNGDWTSATFKAVTIPVIDGYTPTIKQAHGSNLTAIGQVSASHNYVDPQITITYNANDQHIDYQFVDDDNNGSNVGSAIEVDGKTDGTVDPSQTVKIPAGYKLATGQSIPTSYKFKASGNDTVEIHLVHGTKTVQPGQTPNPGTKVPGDNGHKTPGDGKPKNDISYTDLHKDITRTITDYIPGQAVPTVTTQTVSYQRTATIDDVTGDVTYGDWTVNPTSKEKSLAEYDVKAVSGYTPSITKVDAETPTSYQVQNWTDPNIVIKYTAGDQSMIYTFVDDDNHGATVGSPVTITGNTNQNVPTGLIVPDGYKLAEGQTLPTSYTFQSSNPGVDIHLKHVISPVIKAGNEPKPGDKIPDTKGKTYPDDATKDKNFEHDVTRTVTINIPNGTPQVNVQKVHFTRTGTVDAVTGKISYTDWTSDNTTFSEIDAPVENGYVADKAKADKVTGVKESDPDSTVTINYKKVGSYVPVDDKGNQIPGTSKTPYTNDPTDPTKVQTKVPSIPGYTPENGSSQTPADPTKDTDVKYTANDQNIKYQFVDDDNRDAQGNPNNVGSAIEVDGKTNETVDPSKKLIIPAGYQLASGQSIPTSVKLSLDNPLLGTTVEVHLIHGTRTINPGDVPTPGSTIPGDNGKKKPGDGKPKNDISYDDLHKDITRTINVYWSNTLENATTTTVVIKQTVSYQRSATIDDLTGTVTYGNWNLSSSNHIWPSYNVEHHNNFTSHVSGSNLADDATSITANNDVTVDTTDVIVNINYSKVGDMPVNYAPSPNNDDMNKYVTRTIIEYDPNSTTPHTTVQTVHFVRGGSGKVAGYKDSNGHITWTPWTVADNNNVSTGKSEGTWAAYNADETKTYNDKTYTATIDGQIGHVVQAKNDVTTETEDAKVVIAYQTTLKPGDSGVDPNKPGKDYADMFADPTRTINVYKPGETNPEVQQQIVWFGRTKTISTVPESKPIYGDWELGKIVGGKFIVDSTAENEWPEFSAPDVSEYTADPSSVKEQTVTAETKSVTIDIHYVANGNSGGSQGGNNQPTPQGQIIIKYIDPNGKTVNTVTVPVAKGSTTDPSGAIKSNVPKGYKLPDGYTAPTSASEGSTISVSIVPINHKNPKPTSGGNKHKPTHNNKPSRKGKSRQTNAPKHNAKSGSNSAPLSERGPRGRDLSGHNLAALEAEKGIGQNGVKIVKISGQNGSHNANTLPQTGENDHRSKIMSTIGFLGLTAAGIIALLTLGGDRRRE